MKVDRTAELQVQSLKQREQATGKVDTAHSQSAQATDKSIWPLRYGSVSR